MNKILFFIIGLLSTLSLSAQEPTVLENKIYKDNLRTVRLHLANSPVSYPIVSLNSRTSLLFYFDDVEPETKDYVYTLQHCNEDWTPSDLTELEYLDGFTEADIRNYDFSHRVFTNFVHYQVSIPNQDIRWTKSGNYALKVYEETEGGGKDLVIVRRFMVAENQANVQVDINYPSKVSLQRSHHEIDFSVSFKENFKVRSPLKEVSATVLQNGRWDNAIINLSPLFIRQEVLLFDYQNKIIFPAGKEWRHLDLRSFENRSDKVFEIIELEDGVDVVLYPDISRGEKAYHSRIDLNGQFVIENLDRFRNRTSNTFNRTYNKEQNLESDYALVYFSLESSSAYYDQDVYVFGGLTDFALKEEFKMEYNEEHQAYMTEVWLKQGYYDYAYVVVQKGKKDNIDLSELEGDWYETKNDYTILVYYRPVGGRYDQLIGVRHVNTGQ